MGSDAIVLVLALLAGAGLTFAVVARRGSNQTLASTDVTDTDKVLLTQDRKLSVLAQSVPTTVTNAGEPYGVAGISGLGSMCQPCRLLHVDWGPTFQCLLSYVALGSYAFRLGVSTAAHKLSRNSLMDRNALCAMTLQVHVWTTPTQSATPAT
jgi:hypothetical protein